MAEIRSINYSGRDFDSFRESLKTYLQQYYPTTFNDFNRASGLMAILDSSAYIGDVLSYYLDNNINAIFSDSSTDRETLYKLAKNNGYKPVWKKPSYTPVDISVTFPTPSTSGSLAFILKSGTQFLSNTDPQITFELKDDVNFADAITSNTKFETTEDGLKITKQAIAIAGQTKSESFSVTVPEKFYRYKIDDEDITEVLSLTSSDGNTWYEVNTLAQDFIFTGIRNPDVSVSSVPYLLTMLFTERRYETLFSSTGNVYLQFGSSYISNENTISIPNPEDFVQNNVFRGQNQNFIIKPASIETYLNNSSLGALPVNTTMTVIYRVGGGIETNIPQGTLNVIRNKNTVEVNPAYVLANQRAYQVVLNSLEVNNPEPAQGGEDEEDVESLRRNIQLYSYAQSRLVDDRDYEFFSKQMPAVYGSIFRSKAFYNKKSDKIEISVLTRDIQNKLQKSHEYLKNNLKNYFSIIKPLDDNVVITDGEIINIGVTYTLSIDKQYNQSQVIINTINTIKAFLAITNFDMGEPISKPELIQKIQELEGVLSVVNLNIVNISGTVDQRQYSDYTYDITANTRNGFIYPNKNAQFEIKFPEYDIIVQTI